MNKREMICIVCPKGCRLTVDYDNDEYIVTGNSCKRGITYGINEVKNPLRKVTSTVKIIGGIYTTLPVITDREIPKDLIPLVMEEINKVTVTAPVGYEDVIISNVLNKGFNIIASRSMDSKENNTYN